VDLQLYYASKDCTGQPYVQDGYINPDGVTVTPEAHPAWAQWDGTNFWAPAGPAEIATMNSAVCYGTVCNGAPEGKCQQYNPYYSAFAPATRPPCSTFPHGAPRLRTACRFSERELRR
jgi:hypothetical protein